MRPHGKPGFYAAEAFACCVAEYWGDDWLITPGTARLAVLRADLDLQLLSLMGSDATKVGTLAAVTMDGDRQVTQEWGRYWYEHPQFRRLHGLCFPSSHTSDPACAFWERAAGAFTVLFDEPCSHRPSSPISSSPLRRSAPPSSGRSRPESFD